VQSEWRRREIAMVGLTGRFEFRSLSPDRVGAQKLIIRPKHSGAIVNRTQARNPRGGSATARWH